MKTAVIGPLGDDQHDMLGPWWGQRRRHQDAVTRLRRHQGPEPGHDVHRGLHGHRTTSRRTTTRRRVRRRRRLRARRSPRPKAADQVVLALGETREQSGEADVAQRASTCPGRQEELDRGDQGDRQAVRGRAVQRPPARRSSERRRRRRRRSSRRGSPASQAGNAVADVLFGKVNPGGKLPVSFPRSVGQVPIYYNHEHTGRPCDATQKYNSRYRDIPSCDPQYVFGYGLSYTQVRRLEPAPELDARCRANGKRHGDGRRARTPARPTGDEVVQLYIHDPVASISQPVRRLRGFERVTLEPGQTKTVTFTLDASDVGLLRQRRASSSSSRGRSTSTPATARRRTLTKSFQVTG